MKEIFMETCIKTVSSVERNKAASSVCKRLFPQWAKPPTQGELQRIINEAVQFEASEEEILQAGFWWLWARELAIENTFSKQMQISMMRSAVKAAVGISHINFVSCRSPELLHAQVSTQGDLSLPRSRKALEKLGQIVACSRNFLPTVLTIIFADLAIDNIEEIEKNCNIEQTIAENIDLVAQICQEMGLTRFQIVKMSLLHTPNGNVLGNCLSRTGIPKTVVVLDERAETLIKTAARESFASHQAMFGWTQEESLQHNHNLGITMGLVGQAIQQLPSAVLIHNEAFIARGALNNLLTDPKDPLPVICLKDLLERKPKKC